MFFYKQKPTWALKAMMLCLFCFYSIGINAEDIPDDEIWYTSKYGQVVRPDNPNVFGATIVSNTYTNGKGIIKFNGKVTSIGNGAFYECSGLTSITIPNSVTTIGGHAFASCSGLTSISIPNSVKEIEGYAFEDCRGLTSISIPNSVTTIGNYAFMNCSSLTSISIPNSVTTIGNYAFRDCSGLTSVTIPNSVTSIGYSAFMNCSGLTSVTIPNMTSIEYSAFSGCSGLTDVIIDIVDWANRNVVAMCNDFQNKKITYAYKGIPIEGTYTIPNTVTSIGEYALYKCSGLTTLTIPNSVTTIGQEAFWGCSSLTSISIPNSVTEIGGYAFEDCRGLTSVTIPNSVTSIGEGAFYNCSGLISVTIPNSVTSIGDYAFYNCSGLTSISIPNSVTGIGGYAFEGCSGLTSVTIPNSVTTIGGYAFQECSNLDKVYVQWDRPISLSKDAFSYNGKGNILSTLYVPKGRTKIYEAADVWGDFYEIQEYDFKIIDATSIAFSAPSYTLVEGYSCRLKPAVAPKNNTATLTWTSSNSKVATVDSRGYINALSEGKATITVTTNNDLSTKCDIIVKAAKSGQTKAEVQQKLTEVNTLINKTFSKLNK